MTSWRVLHIVSRATGACLAFLCLTPASAWALTTHQTETLMLIEREWRYLSDRCEETTQVLGELPRLAEILEEARGIQERSEASDEALLSDRRELAERLGSLSAEVNRIAAPGGEFAATFVEPYERFSPTYVPAAEPAETFRIVALPGEYHAAAIALTNCTDRSARYKIDLQGLRGRHFDVDIRQHVFVGDWYYKG
ncbi:MAG TPA: hypothetical protein QGH10_04910, partial [Armatimonadota bacterium]|nr:hypothetical protein [Armatimonadota bacterium]